MGASFYIYGIAALFIVIGAWQIIRFEQKKRFARKQNRGIEPEHSAIDKIIVSGTTCFTDTVDQSFTKDPQIHAKAFVPEKARQK
ncbi:hypothetical protein [Yoonia sp. 2307UL14-13]|uniref:hypothetical protein n=1 Tax=Yoonia sp. 2307UL14-13 TaxID=3126506 RepID=UPI00309C4476